MKGDALSRQLLFESGIDVVEVLGCRDPVLALHAREDEKQRRDVRAAPSYHGRGIATHPLP